MVHTPKYQWIQSLQKQLHLPSLTHLQPAAIQKMIDHLNAPEHYLEKLKFIGFAILPTITYFEKKISSSSFQLFGAVKQIVSASGTIEPDTLPKDMHVLETKTAPIGNLLAL